MRTLDEAIDCFLTSQTNQVSDIIDRLEKFREIKDEVIENDKLRMIADALHSETLKEDPRVAILSGIFQGILIGILMEQKEFEV